MISVLGTEQDPFLVYDTIDTSFPTLGLVKMRFLQASEAMGDVDIYVGGELPEHLKLQGVNYKQLTPYVESTQEAFWNVSYCYSRPGCTGRFHYSFLRSK